jgi:hypothetical protein
MTRERFLVEALADCLSLGSRHELRRVAVIFEGLDPDRSGRVIVTEVWERIATGELVELRTKIGGDLPVR